MSYWKTISYVVIVPNVFIHSISKLLPIYLLIDYILLYWV
jgi:hypothetical protein